MTDTHKLAELLDGVGIEVHQYTFGVNMEGSHHWLTLPLPTLVELGETWMQEHAVGFLAFSLTWENKSNLWNARWLNGDTFLGGMGLHETAIGARANALCEAIPKVKEGKG